MIKSNSSTLDILRILTTIDIALMGESLKLTEKVSMTEVLLKEAFKDGQYNAQEYKNFLSSKTSIKAESEAVVINDDSKDLKMTVEPEDVLREGIVTEAEQSISNFYLMEKDKVKNTQIKLKKSLGRKSYSHKSSSSLSMGKLINKYQH